MEHQCAGTVYMIFMPKDGAGWAAVMRPVMQVNANSVCRPAVLPSCCAFGAVAKAERRILV